MICGHDVLLQTEVKETLLPVAEPLTKDPDGRFESTIEHR